jgi:hypothetical protein
VVRDRGLNDRCKFFELLAVVDELLFRHFSYCLTQAGEAGTGGRSIN